MIFFPNAADVLRAKNLCLRQTNRLNCTHRYFIHRSDLKKILDHFKNQQLNWKIEERTQVCPVLLFSSNISTGIWWHNRQIILMGLSLS